jgi:hypothetical protein
MELEYLENFKNLKILRTLINLKSTDGKINAKRLGAIAIKSIRDEKLNKYFILTLRLLVKCLSSTQDHIRPTYSKEKIRTEKYSKILKSLLYCKKRSSTVSRITIKTFKKIKTNRKISTNLERTSFSFAGSNNTHIFFLNEEGENFTFWDK